MTKSLNQDDVIKQALSFLVRNTKNENRHVYTNLHVAKKYFGITEDIIKDYLEGKDTNIQMLSNGMVKIFI